MDNGLGRLAGAAAFVLMLVRLGRLLDTGPEAPDWQLIMLASAFLGGVIWWLLGQTVNNKRVSMAIFVVAGLALFFRIAVPDTLLLGFVPTPDTLGGLGDELGQTLDLIRFGVAPVFPTSGLVAVLAVLMWITGALYVWGATAGPSIAMIAPSLGLYLQFAVMDRIPGGPIWMGAVAVVIALALASIGIERRQEAGRVRDVEGRPLARRAGGMALILAALVAGGSLFVADTASSLVPATGNVRWRYGGGYGPGFGGVTFDRLADLHQSIIRRTNAVVFRATLDPNAPPADEIYWRMESLDFFDGEAWRPTASRADFYEPGIGGGNPEHAYRGTSQEITQRVQIAALRSQVLPTVGVGQFFRSESVNVSAFQITPDGSAIYQAELDEGDEYEAQSILPLQDADLGALATIPNGTLSPLFANAAEAGATSMQPGEPPGDVTPPSDIARFTDLTEEVPRALGQEARRQTAGASTPFRGSLAAPALVPGQWRLRVLHRGVDRTRHPRPGGVAHGPGEPELPDRILRAVRRRHGLPGPCRGDPEPGGLGIHPGHRGATGRRQRGDRCPGQQCPRLGRDVDGWVRLGALRPDSPGRRHAARECHSRIRPGALSARERGGRGHPRSTRVLRRKPVRRGRRRDRRRF